MKFPTLLAASLLVQQAACHQMASTPPSTPNEAAHEAAWNGVDQHASSMLEEQRVPLLYTTTEAWATLEPFPVDVVDPTTRLEKRNAFGPGLSSATKIGLAAGTAGISVASYAVGHSIGKKEGLISGMKGGRGQGGMGMGGGMYKRDDAEAALQERALPKGHLTKLIGAGAGAASVGVLAGYGTHKAVTAHRVKAANVGGMGGGEMAPMKRSDDDDVDLVKRMKMPKNVGKLAVGALALTAGGAAVGYGGHSAVVRHREQKAAAMGGGGGGGGDMGAAPMRRRSVTHTPYGPVGAGGQSLGFVARQRSLAARDDDKEAPLMARDGKTSLVTFLKSKPGIGLSVGAVGLGAGYAKGRSHNSRKTAAPSPAGADMAAPASDMGAPM